MSGMVKEIGGEILDELRGFVRSQVVAGFDPAEQIVEDSVELFEDETGDTALLRSAAAGLVREELAAHFAAQRDWPKVTDCDRLDAAFADLDEAGVVSRGNFSCCGTCGVGEIVEEALEVSATGRSVRGYAFYHVQDTEAAVDGYGVWLSYGALVDGDPPQGEGPHLQIAAEVTEQLRARGLHPEWSGSLSDRIRVPLDWKRHRAQ